MLNLKLYNYDAQESKIRTKVNKAGYGKTMKAKSGSKMKKKKCKYGCK